MAARARAAPRTIARFEAGRPVKLETIEALRSALVNAGVLFVDVDGRPGVTVPR